MGLAHRIKLPESKHIKLYSHMGPTLYGTHNILIFYIKKRYYPVGLRCTYSILGSTYSTTEIIQH
jgi:hypothetical protein